jgi:hypothetical protein
MGKKCISVGRILPGALPFFCVTIHTCKQVPWRLVRVLSKLQVAATAYSRAVDNHLKCKKYGFKKAISTKLTAEGAAATLRSRQWEYTHRVGVFLRRSIPGDALANEASANDRIAYALEDIVEILRSRVGIPSVSLRLNRLTIGFRSTNYIRILSTNLVPLQMPKRGASLKLRLKRSEKGKGTRPKMGREGE